MRLLRAYWSLDPNGEGDGTAAMQLAAAAVAAGEAVHMEVDLVRNPDV